MPIQTAYPTHKFSQFDPVDGFHLYKFANVMLYKLSIFAHESPATPV